MQSLRRNEKWLMDCTDRRRNFNDRSVSEAERFFNVEDLPRTSKDDMLSHTHASGVVTPIQDSTMAKVTAKVRTKARAEASATPGSRSTDQKEVWIGKDDGWRRAERRFPVKEEGAKGMKVKRKVKWKNLGQCDRIA